MNELLTMFLGLGAVKSHTEAAALLTAWFVGMGLHEGAHAWMANRLGDPLPRMMGKLTFNPFRHIEWRNMSYVFGAVLIPIATTYSLGIPLGMAYVMVQRMGTAHDAKVAIAGPVGSFIAALIGVAILMVAWPAAKAGVLGFDNENLFLIFGAAMVYVSLLYAVFNLIPLPPLDGGTVAYHFLNNDGKRMFDAIQPYGFLILIGMFWFLPPITGGAVDPGRDVLWPTVWFLQDLAYMLPRAVWG